MKCVMNNDNGRVFRVVEEEARELVETGRFSYCAKKFWKEDREREKEMSEEQSK